MIPHFLGLLLLFVAFAVPVGLLVGFFVWIVKTWRRGRKRLFWTQVGIVVVAVVSLVFCLDLTPASHGYWEQQRLQALSGHTADWTGVSFAFARKTYSYDSERCWNGDGRTVIVLELSPEMMRHFNAPPPEFFTQYPRISAYKKGWRVVHWRTGAPRDDEKRILDFAFIQADDEEMAQLKKTFAAARRALAKPTTHYAYIYRYPERKNPSDIDLYVIDPDEGFFYLINLNT